jgi:hypothetical protein
MPTFKHSGTLGDLIYSLPAAQALGGGTYYLRLKGGYWWTHLFGDPVLATRDLLEAQPYIDAVEAWGGRPVDYDFDDYREFHSRNACRPKLLTITEVHAMVVGANLPAAPRPWLTAPPLRVPGYDVIVHCTPRYRSPYFDWRAVMDAYRSRALFIGLPGEHEAFESANGKVEYYRPVDLYEIARLVAGCELFVGNQSSPYAIAEGLQKQAILEVSPEDPNCCFRRPGVLATMVYP